MQSRRGIIPEVKDALTFKQAVQNANHDTNIIFYECGGDSVKTILNEDVKSIGMFIGSEGGFEEQEVQLVLENSGKSATLGKRILRAETAALSAIGCWQALSGDWKQ